jgi:hypothetical protein
MSRANLSASRTATTIAPGRERQGRRDRLPGGRFSDERKFFKGILEKEDERCRGIPVG